MDTIILKCANYMFGTLIVTDAALYDMSKPSVSDYDIFESVLDDEGWRVILHCELAPERMFDFKHRNDKNVTAVTTYVRAHSFVVEF